MKIPVSVEVNGQLRKGNVEPQTLLAQFIREDLGLTGTHIGCETTNCGACAVLLDGRAVKSCAVFAVQANGKEVVTIEGIGTPEALNVIQYAFWKKHGLQCGFCTPGMIISTYALLKKNPNPSDDEIRRGLSGNLCRCTGYVKIIEAVKYAARLKRGGRTVFKVEPRHVKKRETEFLGEGW